MRFASLFLFIFLFYRVIPANAGTQGLLFFKERLKLIRRWVPACAGMTIWLVSLSYAQTLPPTLIVSNMTYNAAGQVTQVNFGNGDVTTYTYNDLNLRLTQLKTVKTGGTVVQDLNYTYDAVGNILSITDNVGQADQTFQYDHLNRLTQATGQNYGTKTYSYDVLGNITQKDGLTYTYDNIAGGPHAVTSLSDGTTFTYDANGNMATQQKGSDLKVFIYDAENRLIEVKLNGTTVESYEYDGDGGRTKKLPNSSTPNTKFIGQMYEEQGTRKTSYIFLGDQRIAAVTNGAILYFHGDHLGSANIVSDSSGTIKELSEYEPYGQFSRHEKYGTPEEQAYFYFTNQYLDETTSLYYYGARYYHPLIGRFITADSIVQAAGYSQAFNRYSYVLNNPINRIDPSGYSSDFWNSFVGAFIGAIATIAFGPAGLGIFSTWAAAGAVGGALGGSVAGGLNGGWQGAFMGAVTGGVFGAIGGWAYGADNLFGKIILGGMFVAGVANAEATDSWDSFAGGIVGGMVGTGVGSYFFDGISNANPTEGDMAGVAPEGNDHWANLGVLTSDAKAQMHANVMQESVFYTKSRGLSDFVRAGLQKVLRGSKASRQYMEYAKAAAGKKIYAHSEGTLTLAGAIRQMRLKGLRADGLHIEWNGPVIFRSTAASLAKSIGATSEYHLNTLDPIGIFTTLNPLRLTAYGVGGAATLANYHSTEYYP